jgi:NADPH:quinone reductase-like Zn-dependent oxidoreductase
MNGQRHPHADHATAVRRFRRCGGKDVGAGVFRQAGPPITTRIPHGVVSMAWSAWSGVVDHRGQAPHLAGVMQEGTMARVIRFHKLGGPEVLQMDELPAQQPGEGELRIAVRALGLNRAEASFRAGRYLSAPTLPSRIGYEAAGLVDAVGPGVEGFEVGDAVSTIPAFAMDRYGVYGDQVVVPAAAVAKHPANLSFEQAAAIWMQYLTAWGALVEIGGLSAGEAVLITAASSSVGIAAIQIANALGAIPIASTRTSAKRAELQRLGAEHVIASEEQDLPAEVRRITGGRGARLVFDPVAGPGVVTLSQAMAPGGVLFVYGGLSGEPTPFPRETMRGGLSMRGYTLFEITNDPARLARGKQFVTEGLAQGKLTPIIARVFDFADIVESHRYLESNQQIGKIIVKL